MSAFGGKADMTFALQMSAYDPKRTSAPLPVCWFRPVRWLVLSLGGINEAARVHHASRRRGSVAARGAAQQPERMRRIGVLMAGRGRSGRTGPPSGVPAGLAATGLDRRPQRADRYPLGAEAMHPTLRKYAAELVALAPDVILAVGSCEQAPLLQATRTVPIVFVSVRRSGRRWLRREPGAAGRQRHRLYHIRIQFEREMAGTAQADRAGRDACGGPS